MGVEDWRDRRAADAARKRRAMIAPRRAHFCSARPAQTASGCDYGCSEPLHSSRMRIVVMGKIIPSCFRRTRPSLCEISPLRTSARGPARVPEAPPGRTSANLREGLRSRRMPSCAPESRSEAAPLQRRPRRAPRAVVRSPSRCLGPPNLREGRPQAPTHRCFAGIGLQRDDRFWREGRIARRSGRG